MKYVPEEWMRGGTSVGKTRWTTTGREREDDEKQMKYVPGEWMRRGPSVGREREDDGENTKYILGERIRGRTSVGKTRWTNVEREGKDDEKYMKYLLSR